MCFAARSPRPRLLLRRSRNGTWAPSRPLPAQQMEQQLLPCCRKCDLFFLSAAALQRSSNARKRFGCPNSPRRAWGSFQVGEIPLLGARTPFPTLPLQPPCLSPAPRSLGALLAPQRLVLRAQLLQLQLQLLRQAGGASRVASRVHAWWRRPLHSRRSMAAVLDVAAW